VNDSGTHDGTGLPPVVLCGPIAAAGEPARGGYQACNRRTIEALRAAGVDVRELPFPHPRARGLRKLLQYAIGFLRLYARVWRLPPGVILHLTALSAHFIYLEWVLVHLARLRGVPVLFDLRAGAGLINYRRGGPLYRLAFDGTARSARLCLVEGAELVEFVRESSRRPTSHFPNHLDTRRIPQRNDARLPDAPVIAYAGRLVPEKGLEVLLDACRALCERGLSPALRIAGEGDPLYLSDLRQRYADLDVQWLGPLPANRVLALFLDAHFFLFPSRHHGEGQSNALTEAMACGCVPVVSRHGFNASVTGSAGVVLDPHASPNQYAEEVAAIWAQQHDWRERSRQARERMAQLFDTQAVVAGLLNHYRGLLDSRNESR
jgi:glycosyltransferase involved in cell wall biosynthesis